MKSLLSLLIAITISGLAYSQTEEVIKIEVDSDCKNFIRKRQYKDQLYTNPVKIITAGYNKVHLGYSYKENMKMLVFTYNEWAFKYLNVTEFYATINGKEFVINKMALFKTHKRVNVILNEVTLYQIGVLMTDEMIDEFSNLNSLSLGYIKSPSQKRKVWEVSGGDLKKLKKSFNCFTSYSGKMKEEFEANLKKYATNFRKSKWGQSKYEVKTNENDEEIKDIKDDMVQSVTLNNDPYKAFYYFNNGQLYQGVYDFEGEYINENNFYSKYKEVSNILSKKYGAPLSVNKYRKGRLWKDSDEIGMALKMGEYSEVRRWETKDTEISLEITGENYKVDMHVRYRTKDIELLKEVKETVTEESTEGF